MSPKVVHSSPDLPRLSYGNCEQPAAFQQTMRTLTLCSLTPAREGTRGADRAGSHTARSDGASFVQSPWHSSRDHIDLLLRCQRHVSLTCCSALRDAFGRSKQLTFAESSGKMKSEQQVLSCKISAMKPLLLQTARRCCSIKTSVTLSSCQLLFWPPMGRLSVRSDVTMEACTPTLRMVAG